MLLSLACLLLLLSCSEKNKAAKIPYRITGSVKNCEGCEVKMRAEVHRKFQRIDSTVVKGGSFTLEGYIPESGMYTVDVKYSTKFVPAKVYLPADSVHLTVDGENKFRTKFYTRDGMGSWLKYGYATSSSPIQDELEKYLLTRDSLWNKAFDEYDLVLEKYRQTFDSRDKALVQQWADSVENFGYRFDNYWSHAADLFVQQGATSEMTLFAIMDNRNDRMATDRFKAYLAALPNEHQQSPQGQYLANYLAENEQRNKNNQRFVNSRIRNLDLKGSTPAGVEVDESEIFKANKLTLVEFWASWCGPCRMVMPEYYELYKEYKDKGMGFIAVSMDNRRDLWIKAIEQDGFDIHHVSELKGGKGDDMKRFEIKGIPANMLVDETGKIVAVDISRVDLRNKLQESL
jgi:thiol-disulfide isomerase/thioredoxin